MAKSDRLLRLMQLLRSLPAPVQAQRLAETQEVSLRTIYRDIDSLRSAGAVIDGEPGLGYTLVEDIALPPQTLSRLEIEALTIGLSEVRHRGDPALAQAALDALSKINATLKEDQQRDVLHAVSQVYRFGRPEPASVDITALREASWSEKELDLVYKDQAGAITERRVRPLAVLYFDYAVMLLAFCCLRQDYRTFHVTQIQKAVLTSESFRPNRVPLLRAYVNALRQRMAERGEEFVDHSWRATASNPHGPIRGE